MKRWLFENLGLKLLALFITFSLWAYVGSRSIMERKITLHLELTDIPAGMRVDSNVRTTVPVILTGRKDTVLDLDPEDLSAVVSLKGYSTPKREILLRPKVQPLPGGVDATVNSISIRLIPLTNK